MKEHQTERWEHIDTCGSPDILYEAGEKYPAGTSFHYALHAGTVVPDLGEKPEGTKLGIYFEGLDGKADIYVTDGVREAHAHHPSDSPWFGHYRPEMMMTCGEFAPGDRAEIWVMIHDCGRVNGIGWPVRWIYTTDADVKALDEKTAREWRSSTLND